MGFFGGIGHLSNVVHREAFTGTPVIDNPIDRTVQF